MSASPTSSPASPATTPARGTKAKAAAEKSAEAQSASAAQAVAALLLPGSAPAAAPTPPGTAAGAIAQAPSGDAVGAPTDPAASNTSAATAAPAAPEVLAATTANSAGDAPDTVARAAQGLTFAAAALLGPKPAPQAPADGRNVPGGESDAEPGDTTAPANPATAAPIVLAHAAPPPLVTAGAHDSNGLAANAQPGPITDKPADLSAAQAALGGASGAGNTAPPAAAPAPQTTVTVPVHAEVGSSSWAQELGVRLNWMAQAGISSASLKLTPAQLGPVEVKISVHQNTASVWFGAAQPDTRAALEQALPKLRDMFSSQGLNLAHTGVSDQSARGAERQAHSATVLAPAALRELNATPVAAAARTLKGLVDTYA